MSTTERKITEETKLLCILKKDNTLIYKTVSDDNKINDILIYQLYNTQNAEDIIYWDGSVITKYTKDETNKEFEFGTQDFLKNVRKFRLDITDINQGKYIFDYLMNELEDLDNETPDYVIGMYEIIFSIRKDIKHDRTNYKFSANGNNMFESDDFRRFSAFEDKCIFYMNRILSGGIY